MSDKTDYLKQVLTLFQKAVESGQLTELFPLLLTCDEMDAIAIRVQIIKELLKGELNQRELKERLGTGIATITRGSNSLKQASPQFKEWINQQINQNS